MDLKPREIQQLRKTFNGSLGIGMSCPDVTLDGADIEVRLVPETGETGVVIPYNEQGDAIFLKLDNATLKRWRVECKEAVRIIRRAASGERDTAFHDLHKQGERSL